MSSANIIDWLIRGGGAVAILGLITWIVRSRTQLWQAQSKHVRTATFLNHLLDLCERVVAEIQQTYVDTLRQGGDWDDKAQEAARQRAVEKLKSYLGVEGWKMLGWLLSTDDKGTLEAYLGTQVEATVRKIKEQEGAIGALVSANANPPLASSH